MRKTGQSKSSAGRGGGQRKGSHGPAKGGATDHELDLMHEQAMSRLQNIKILVLGAVGVCLLLALTPVVSYLAGRSTLVDINIAVALTVSVSVGWAITGGIAHQRGRSLRRVEGRNKDLERRLHEASFQVEEYRSETAALRARWEQEVVTSSHLREDLEALRGDLVRLRDDAHPHGARGA